MRKGASVDWKAPQSLRDSSPVGSAFHKKRVHPLRFGRSPTAADAVIRHGDGAGILMSMPDEFMRATAGVELPEAGHYAAGIAFLDRDIATSGQQEQAIASIVREEGLEVLAWRVVPTNPDGLGLQALASMPSFKTLVIADAEGKLAGIELDRKTFRIRKRVEHEVGIYFASLSARTITYKGMLTTMQDRKSVV